MQKRGGELEREEKLGFGVRRSRDLCGACSLVQDLARRKEEES